MYVCNLQLPAAYAYFQRCFTGLKIFYKLLIIQTYIHLPKLWNENCFLFSHSYTTNLQSIRYGNEHCARYLWLLLALARVCGQPVFLEPLNSVNPTLLERDEWLVVQVCLGGGDVEISIDYQHAHCERVKLQMEIDHMLRRSGQVSVQVTCEYHNIRDEHHQKRRQLSLLPNTDEAHGRYRLRKRKEEDCSDLLSTLCHWQPDLIKHFPKGDFWAVSDHIKLTQGGAARFQSFVAED